jgi:hypothetical protein
VRTVKYDPVQGVCELGNELVVPQKGHSFLTVGAGIGFSGFLVHLVKTLEFKL